MSKFAYEFANGYQPDNHTNNKNSNLNCIYIASKSPPLYHNLNSVSSNTYSSYDTKLSSNNSKTSNVSSSNESSMLNNSYHSTNDDYIEPQFKQTPIYTSKNYCDQRYTSYIPPNEALNSPKHSIKIKNLPNDKARLNETILRNKISDYKPSFNPLSKRHSVNIDSYPSTPRSNLSTPPVQEVRSSNEKLLSYEYLSNSNYDRILNGENLDKSGEGSYSMLTGSMNKERKAKSIINVSSDYSRVAGNLENVKPEIFETVSNSESPLYRKIMSKLSEIPDSIFTKSPPITENSPNQKTQPISLAGNDKNVQELSSKNKANHRVKIATTLNNPRYSNDPKYVSLIDVNQQNKQNIMPIKDTRLVNKETKRSKYKSMYFDPKIFNEDYKTNGTQSVISKEKVNSQAGDLIYTSLPFYSSSLPKKTSNPTYDINDYLYSDESSKISREPNKIEDKTKKTVEQENFRQDANLKSKESVGVNNKNGINAYIKLIDTSQNKQKNVSSLDEFAVNGLTKHSKINFILS